MYAYFEPLLLKWRLVPLSPTEKLSHYRNGFVSFLFPPTAVIWNSCITILSLKTVLWSPSSYNEVMYRQLPQNSIFSIWVKLILLLESWFGLAWPFCFCSLHPSHPQNLLPGTRHLHTQLDSPWQPRHKPAPGSYLIPPKAVGFVRDYPQTEAGPYRNLLLKRHSTFTLPNSVTNQNA